MNPHLIVAIIFSLLLSLFLFMNRKNIEIKGYFPIAYIIMYKSDWGIAIVNKIAKRYRKTILRLHTPIIIFSIICIIFIIGILVYGFYVALLPSLVGYITTTPAVAEYAAIVIPEKIPEQVVSISLVLPITVKNQLYVPFIYWLLSIIIVVIIHESAHALICAANNIRIKNTGIAIIGLILPIIPAAYVEPDEEQLKQAKAKAQLTMFAAGSIANITTGIVALTIWAALFIYSPISYDGLTVGMTPESVLYNTSMRDGDIIKEIDGQTVTSVKEYKYIVEGKDQLTITTERDTYVVPFDGLLKIYLSPHYAPGPMQWLLKLIEWIATISIGIGLTNLLPTRPLDGGHMLNIALGTYMEKKQIKTTQSIVSCILLVLIIGLVILQG